MIGLPAVYAVGGLLFAGFALASLKSRDEPRPLTAALFLGLIAASLLFGDRLGDLGEGLVALVLAGLGARGFGGRRGPEPPSHARSRAHEAARWGDRLFLLALVVPSVAIAGTFLLKELKLGASPLVDPRQASLVALALGVLVALGAGLLVLRAPPQAPFTGGGALARAVGWALILPQMLAALGALFVLSGVGQAVADLALRVAPADDRLAMVAIYTGGMALLTAVMGNAFAAFPVMTAGVGLPILVRRLHGDPAILGAIGMLSGFCGTLVSPMAANFNIVPVTLLELPDRSAVIRVQAPTAILLLLINTALMYLLLFRF